MLYYFWVNLREILTRKIAGAEASRVNGEINDATNALGNGTLVFPVKMVPLFTTSVTVRDIPVGEDGTAVLFKLSCNSVADTSAQVPPFRGLAPSQLRKREKSSLNSI